MKFNIIRVAVYLILLAMVVIATAGCQADAPIVQPIEPAALPAPPVPHVEATPTPATKAAVVLLRDTEALRSKVTRYVVRKDSKPEVIDKLTAPTAQLARALERLQARKTRAGYQLSDVIAARVAADALAAVYQVQILTPTATQQP